jgi:DNA repair exonuclease SbcCD nuclease subunit
LIALILSSSFFLISLKIPFSKTLKQSLETIKKQNVDIILFAGDLADISSKEAFNLWKEIYDEIFPSKSPSPILLVTMGNHDYFPNKYIYISVNQAREMFEETFNQKYQKFGKWYF